MIPTQPDPPPVVSTITTISWCAYRTRVPVIMAGYGEPSFHSHPISSSFHLKKRNPEGLEGEKAETGWLPGSNDP
jgi:hypothetical protein